MPSARQGIRSLIGFTLGLVVACSSPAENPELPENVIAKQPVACDSVTPAYDGYSREVTDTAEFHDFSTTAAIKQGVAGYLITLEGNSMPCVVTSPTAHSCNRTATIGPSSGTVAAYPDAFTSGARCVARSKTDSFGAYQLELEPGRYQLRLLDEMGFDKDVSLAGFSGETTEPVLRSADVEIGPGITSFHLVEMQLLSAPSFR